MTKWMLLNFTWMSKPYYDGDGDGSGSAGGSGDGGAGTGNTGAGTGTGGTDDKTNPLKFTKEQQDFINSLQAKHKRTVQEENKKLVAELEALKGRFQGTEAEKQALEARIETLRNEGLTKEQIAQQEYKKTQDKLNADLKKKDDEAKHWKTQFETFRINSALLEEAQKAKAYNPTQILDMFSSKTKLAPSFDADGKEIPGQFDIKMSVVVGGKQMEATPEEVFKLLREDRAYANLFESEGSGGLGLNANNSRGTGTLDVSRIGDPDYYAANRAAFLDYYDKKGLK